MVLDESLEVTKLDYFLVLNKARNTLDMHCYRRPETPWSYRLVNFILFVLRIASFDKGCYGR